MTDRKQYFEALVDANELPHIRRLDTLDELTAQMATEGDRTALSGADGEESYTELTARIARIRGHLAASGVKKGDRVGIYMRNNTDFPPHVLAVATMGAVAVLLPPQLPAAAAAALSAKFRMAYLVHDEALPVEGAACPAGVPAEGDPVPAAEGLTRDTPAVVIFSGGTTGAPKGALLSHGGLLRGAYNGAFSKSPVLHQRYLALIPMTHVFGLVRNMLTVFLTGGQLRLLEDPRAAVRDMATYKPNILILVPALVEMLCGLAASFGPAVLGGELHTIIAGAAPVPPALIDRCRKLGVAMFPGYGLTETCNLVSGNGDILTKPDSVGVPYPEQELKTVDGELLVKGDHLFLGYFGDEAATRAAFDDEGFFRTGDLARFDEDGFLYIIGRTKNVIITSNGENVSPEVLEARLDALPAIKASLVYEGRNAVGRAVLAAELLPETGFGEADVRAAVDGLNGELPAYMRIDAVTVRQEDFERSGAGKILRHGRNS